MPKIDEITNLALQGGSVRGTAYLGALEELEHLGLPLRQIKRVAGTSAGSIVAMLLALGHSPDGMRDIMDALDFKDLLDEPAGAVETRTALLGQVHDAQEGRAVVTTFFSASSQRSVPASQISSRLSRAFGVYDGEFFRIWAEKQLYVTTGIINLTFAELHQLTIDKPEDEYKDLFIIGTNLSTNRSEMFDYIHTPDVIVSDALRISMSIPFLFKPHQLYRKQGDERVLDPKQHVYVDGGLLDNYPIWAFDYKGFVEEGFDPSHPQFWDAIPNPATLGFRLVSQEQIDYFAGHGELLEHSITSLTSFTKAIFQTMRAKENSDHIHRGDQTRTVYIDTVGIDMLAFDLDADAKDRLITSGRNGINKYREQYWPSVVAANTM